MEEVSESITMAFMYGYVAWMGLRLFMSVRAFHGEANALYWKSFERQNSTLDPFEASK